MDDMEFNYNIIFIDDKITYENIDCQTHIFFKNNFLNFG